MLLHHASHTMPIDILKHSQTHMNIKNRLSSHCFGEIQGCNVLHMEMNFSLMQWHRCFVCPPLEPAWELTKFYKKLKASWLICQIRKARKSDSEKCSWRWVVIIHKQSCNRIERRCMLSAPTITHISPHTSAMGKIVHYANRKKFTHKAKYKSNKYNGKKQQKKTECISVLDTYVHTYGSRERERGNFFNLLWHGAEQEQVFLSGNCKRAFEIRKYFYQLFNAFHYFVCLLSTQSLNDPMRVCSVCIMRIASFPFAKAVHIDSQCSSFISDFVDWHRI